MAKDNNRKFYGTGIISILMVFLVLCFTTFGVLSLVSARADMRLSEKNAANVTAYYAADRIAKEAVAKAQLMFDGAMIPTAGSFVGVSDCSVTEDGAKVHFTVPIGEYLQLSVSATYDFSAGAYVFTEYRTVALEASAYESSGQQLVSFESEVNG